MRESVEQKGRRYLAEARLVVRHVAGSTVRATCRGTGATHELGFAHDRWHCSCSARSRCSHLAALQLVTDPLSSDRDRQAEQRAV